MKKGNLISLILFIILIIAVVINFKAITNTISYMLEGTPKVIISKHNAYYKDASYDYVKLSKDFIPYSKQDLKNIFYTILDYGYNEFTFYCPKEYTDCTKDVGLISNDPNTLTHINNFVSPFNNFNSIKIVYSTTGEVNVEINKLYTDEQISVVNNKIDSILSEVITNDMKIDDKVLAIHDYIINHSKYDEDRALKISKYQSNIAYGPLLEGYAVCGGYADAMALFLNRLNIPNYKIASKTHVWNAVFMNNKWLHLDLTWDDPVSVNSEENTLLHKFYLVNTKTLESYNISDHNYDKTIYSELS